MTGTELLRKVETLRWNLPRNFHDRLSDVEMAAHQAAEAIAKLNGQEIESRALRVNEAQSKQQKTSAF